MQPYDKLLFDSGFKLNCLRLKTALHKDYSENMGIIYLIKKNLKISRFNRNVLELRSNNNKLILEEELLEKNMLRYYDLLIFHR